MNNHKTHFSFTFQIIMLIRSIFILIFLQQIYTCPIPFNIQSKCRCAITEIGRVYIYCARKQLTVIPHFNNSKFYFINQTIKIYIYFKAILFSMNSFYPVIEYLLYIKMHLMV